MNWNDAVALITGAGSAHLSTSSSDGQPHVSVVWAVVDGDRVAMTMLTMSGKAGRLRSNPRVALMWEGNSAETYLWGDAELITDSDVKSRVWASGLFPFDLSMFYAGPDTSDWTFVSVTPTRVVAMVSGDSGMERRVWAAS